MNLPTPPLSRVTWNPTYRITPAVYPPIPLFERVADPADWDDLAKLALLTDAQARQAWGEIGLVPVSRRVAGAGASWVMAPFAHPNKRGTRFSDGSYGVYYASRSLGTAIAETVYHMERFYAATRDQPHREVMRTLLGSIDAGLHDIRGDARWGAAHRPDDYSESRTLARALRDGGSDGMVYDSVRHGGGENLAAFWPNVVAIPVPGGHLMYDWNGRAIGRYFDHERGVWIDLP
jgi:hypothetical protein